MTTRVLFSAVPIHGHLLPLLPLARAVAAAGDHPLVAVPESMTDLTDGLPVRVYGPGIELLLAETARRTGGAPMSDYEAVAELFAGTRPDLTYGEALRHAHQQQPALIVADEYDVIGPMLASALDIPLVQHAIGLPVSPPQLATAMRTRTELRYAQLSLKPVDPLALVDPWPPALQQPQWNRPPDRLAIRLPPYATATARPRVPAPAEGRPRVLITLGTVILDRDLLDALIDAVAALDTVDVVALIPPGVDHPLIDARAHVRILPFTPIADLLDEVAVVVSAGGAGTVLAALGRAIPMVVLPLGAEKPMNAERVAAAGAGITISDPRSAGGAVAAVLADPSYTAAVGHLAAQINAAPEPVQVWQALREALFDA
ncbi:glycosyltransferase [Actinoplanes sp. NPDC051851]|uniref:glycosyltransferase n=1 Tax=Actinoplanes sp. NPDC051851 TaxID=3154753 RepID=UPI00341983FD